MRDVGILVWVVLLIVGVIGSIISSARKQAQQNAPRPVVSRRPQPRTFPSAAAAPVKPGAVTPPRAAPESVLPFASASVEPPLRTRRVDPATDRTRLFQNRREIVRAVIAVEVLGKPLALRDEYFSGLQN